MANESSDQSAAPDTGRSTVLRQALPKIVLRGVSGKQFGKTVALPRKLRIGRSSDCDLQLDDPGVSRHHAELERSQEELVLRDLGSANGTYVNGEQITERTIEVGDQIAFDQQRFLVSGPGMEGVRPDAGPSPGAEPEGEAVTSAVTKAVVITVVAVVAATGLAAWLIGWI